MKCSASAWLTERPVREIFEKTEGVVDVDWYVEDDQPKQRILVDREKAALNDITDDDVAKVLRLASAGDSAGLLHASDEIETFPSSCASRAPAVPTSSA